MSAANQLKVFIVDDEAVISLTPAMIFQKSGFDATSFTNQVKTLEEAETEHPDLLLSDVMMPEFSGIELAIRIKKFHPECKIFLLSGQAATADLLQEARVQGHNFILLTKPVHPADLLAQLQKLTPPSRS